MAAPVTVIPSLDPLICTGPTRLMSGVTRTGSVTLDTPYGEYASWLYLGTTGNVSIVKWDGTTQVLNSMAAGIWHNIGSSSINSVGTTAANMVWGS